MATKKTAPKKTAKKTAAKKAAKKPSACEVELEAAKARIAELEQEIEKLEQQCADAVAAARRELTSDKAFMDGVTARAAEKVHATLGPRVIALTQALTEFARRTDAIKKEAMGVAQQYRSLGL